jgi:SAM-dependent methyltransferase
MADKHNVVAHYDRLASSEWERLSKDAYHHLEFRATMDCLRDHLPEQGLILDAGSGPGRYAIELCRKDYDVTLVDVSEKCIVLARENFAAEPSEVRNHLRRAEVGDVGDLSRFADSTFDAVLCLGGPLSHLIEVVDRVKAMSELARVAKAGSTVIISVMGYFGHLRRILARSPDDLVKPERRTVFSEGDHVYAGGYCDTHFFRPEELQSLAEDAGLKTVELRACEGLSSNFPEATNALRERNDGRWERWMEVLDATRSDPAVVATSEHFLYAGRKP